MVENGLPSRSVSDAENSSEALSSPAWHAAGNMEESIREDGQDTLEDGSERRMEDSQVPRAQPIALIRRSFVLVIKFDRDSIHDYNINFCSVLSRKRCTCTTQGSSLLQRRICRRSDRQAAAKAAPASCQRPGGRSARASLCSERMRSVRAQPCCRSVSACARSTCLALLGIVV